MKTMKIFRLLILSALMIPLAGCWGTIETGNVGVRTAWDGEIKPVEEVPGFYTAFWDDVEEFSAREITVEMRDMTPKAGDNLSLEELDLDVFYTIDPNSVAEQTIKYSNRSAYDREHGIWYPSYNLIVAYTRSAAYDVISKYDSLEVHKNRDKIEDEIRQSIIAQLESSDPGIFMVPKVIVRDVKTDRSVEESIKIAVAKNKELEAKQTQVDIAEQEAAANDKLNASLTAEILKNRELDIMEKAVEKGVINFTVIQTSGQAPALILDPNKK